MVTDDVKGNGGWSTGGKDSMTVQASHHIKIQLVEYRKYSMGQKVRDIRPAAELMM
jgi:hypothetical protein